MVGALLRAQGCMKSGEVLTEARFKWYEPDHWRFGDAACPDGKKNYMRHATGQLYGLSAPVARYIGQNKAILHRFANEDTSVGTWLMGLEVQYVDERRFCCDSLDRCAKQVRRRRAGRAVLLRHLVA
jgi:beta-1,3-galactosyltransferase 1/2/3/4/5/7/8